MVCSAQPLNELKRGMTKYPQTLVNVRMEEKVDVLSLPEVARAVAAAEARLADSGRVLLRPSGTEPVVRVMVEGRDRAVVEPMDPVLWRRPATDPDAARPADALQHTVLELFTRELGPNNQAAERN